MSITRQQHDRELNKGITILQKIEAHFQMRRWNGDTRTESGGEYVTTMEYFNDNTVILEVHCYEEEFVTLDNILPFLRNPNIKMDFYPGAYPAKPKPGISDDKPKAVINFRFEVPKKYQI